MNPLRLIRNVLAISSFLLLGVWGAPPNISGFTSDPVFATVGESVTLSWVSEVGNTFTIQPQFGSAIDVPAGEFSIDFTPVFRPGSETLPKNSVWKYLDDSSDQGENWRQLGFDDSAWASGPGILGYGDGIEMTQIDQGNKPNRPITYYFRQPFSIPDLSQFPQQEIELLRDDGAIVYINGVEVLRDNMPEGEIDFQTRSSRAAPSDGKIYDRFPIDNSHFVAGENVIAVEVHQISMGSADTAFDLALVESPRPGDEFHVLLQATNPEGQTTAETVILLGSPNPFIQDFSADVATASPGQAVSFSWQVNQADQISIAPDVGDVAAAIGGTTVRMPTDVPVQPPSQELIPFGADWNFDVTGTDLGTVWREPGFDDSNWAAGPAELGFGDLDEATVLPRLFAPSFYFRKKFQADRLDPSAPIRAHVIADDGAVVYLNGLEIGRVNMPAGPVFFDTVAAGSARLDGRNPVALNVANAGQFLAEGENTIAVSVHNQSISSSDLSFNLQLEYAEPVGAFRTFTMTASDGKETVTAQVAIRIEIAEGDSDLDGLLDSWEYLIFGDLEKDGSGDTDQDGLTDGDEFRAGTDPLDPLARFAIASISPDSGATKITLEGGAPPGSIGVEFSPDLTPGSWLELGNFSEVERVGTFIDNDVVRGARQRGHYRAFLR